MNGAGAPDGNRQYRAFISYSHADSRFALWLHRKIERFAIPAAPGAGRVRLAPVFLDRAELPAATDLSATVRAALARSAALIVIASPHARASRWVDREIALFRELHPDRPVLVALIEGEPDTAFPPALTGSGAATIEPLAADFRKGADGRRLGLLKIVAGLSGQPLDRLVQRDAQARQRRVMAVTAAALLLSLVLAGLLVLALLAGLAAGALLGLALPLQLGLGALGAALPCWRLLRARQRRLARIEQQLPEALDLMGRSMRAGHAFPTALKMVGDELRAPLGSEMRIVFDEVNFGVAMGDALGNLASRVPSTDLRYFVVAVLIQRESGGNLAELLGRISAIIRDRLTLLGEIRTLSAEGRMSAWILSMMPLAVALMMQLSSPDFLRLLYTDPGGRKMLTMALVMMGLGILVIRKVTRIRL